MARLCVADIASLGLGVGVAAVLDRAVLIELLLKSFAALGAGLITLLCFGSKLLLGVKQLDEGRLGGVALAGAGADDAAVAAVASRVARSDRRKEAID